MISVLYADDESLLLDVTKTYLDRTGEFCVTTANSGPSALDLLATTQFDAVISDYQMPVMDGIELLKHVRAASPDLPFIMFTGKGREEIAIEAFENGADFYIQKGGAPKPQFKELAHKIKSAVGRRQAEDTVKLVNRKLQLLASITRHDIMNQLTALKADLDSAEEVETDPEKRDLIRKGQQIAATIEEQILFTRDYQKMGINAPVWQNVSESVWRSARSFLMQDVRIEIDRSDLEIFADPLFKKVFYNLIDNSLRYGGDAMNLIRLSCREDNKGLVCSYEDNGRGIPQENKLHIFERGFGRRMGLGMFFAKEILTITGLTIIENGESGKGVRFEIIVPKGAYRFTLKK
jgi:CheY-like chemotaxis protein